MELLNGFPKQAIPKSKKTEEWCKECIRYAEKNSILSSSLIRNTVAHKKLNYDLYSGVLNMSDLESIINPESLDYGQDIPKIQHYPIMNKLIKLLLGEERAAYFDFKVNITNPNIITEIENKKKEELQQRIISLIQDTSLSDEEYQKRMKEVQNYFGHEWQDLRELMGNCVLNHFRKEQNFDDVWNDGFADVCINNEEIYQCCIEGGIPVIKRINPLNIYALGTSRSSKIEDADMLVVENYLSLGKIIDIYHDKLSKKDVQKLQELTYKPANDDYGDHGDPRNYFRFGDYINDLEFAEEGFISFSDGLTSCDMPHDLNGNIRVLQVYWKSLRKVKDIKSYDFETGETEHNIVTEDYIPDENKGEEATEYYINEAWHGTMIGCGKDAIFVDCGPCQLQFNSMDNPSKCHFGFIGTIYNVNNERPYSMVDQMKPLQYQYDNTQDKLNKLMARNIGKVVQLNASMVPEGWTMDKYVYWLKNKGISVIDPMKEGNSGAAKGKLAGMFNMSPVIDLELGQSITQMQNYLIYLKNEMQEIIGLTPQRMGMIENRETVGGVERSTLQSSHSTRWYFAKHQDTKKRTLECFLEVCKMWIKGHSKKYEYILPDFSKKILDIDGGIFNECDYGIVIDDSIDMQILNQSIDQMSQAALQNNMMKMSMWLKLKANSSMADKIRMIEDAELYMEQQQQQLQEQQAQIQQQQLQQQQMIAEQQAQEKQNELDAKIVMNQQDNETKILVAQIQTESNILTKQLDKENKDENLDNDIQQQKVEEMARQFDENLNFEKKKHQDNLNMKNKELQVKKESISKKSKNTDK